MPRAASRLQDAAMGEGGAGHRRALILASSEVAVPKTTSAPMLVDSAAPATPIVSLQEAARLHFLLLSVFK